MQEGVLRSRSGISRSSLFYLVLGILSIHAALLGWAALVHSPNVNEPAHLVAGLSHWQFGRYELYRVNPPLVRMIASLPVLAAEPNYDWSSFDDSSRNRAEFKVGYDFVAANGVWSLWLMAFARWACIPFSLAGGLVCFFWGRELYGELAGVLGVTLWSLSPSILGHASCITPDAHAAAVGLIANYLFWKWLRSPTWRIAAATGVALGLSLLTKVTWVVLLALWPIQLVLWRLPILNGNPKACVYSTNWRLQFLTMHLLGLGVLGVGYQCDGMFWRVGDFVFISETLSGTNGTGAGNRFQGMWAANLPVPLPAQFVLGADIQKQDFESRPLTYFRGRTYRHGFWYFYLYALVVKVPLGIWLLALARVAFEMTHQSRLCARRDEIVLLTPFLAILAIASLETDYTTHFRYVIPILPYAFIWISKIGMAASVERSRWTMVVIIGLVWLVSSSVSCSPHWLSYFNELGGGPLRGHEHLANSNVDWGQDLLYLRKWVEQHPEARPIGLAYYGSFHPHSIGIEFLEGPMWIVDSGSVSETLNETLRHSIAVRPGYYAVSTNFIVGHYSWHYRADGSRGWFNRRYFTWLKSLQPVARAGYSIQIFRVTESDIRRLLIDLVETRSTPSEIRGRSE